MATLTGSTIAGTYDQLVKRQDSYSQTGSNIEIMENDGTIQATGLYLEGGGGKNVGIGTATPDNTLVVAGGAGSGINIDRYDTTDGNFANLNFMKSANATVGNTSTIVVDNENLGGIRFWGSDGSGFEEAAAIHCEVDGSPSDGTDMPGRLSFWTSPDADDDPLERMTIKSTGNVGIGTTAPDVALHITKTATGGVLRLENSDTTITQNEVLGQIEFEGRDDSQSSSPGDCAGVRAKIAAFGSLSGTTGETDIAFYTSIAGDNLSEKMRIQDDGNVGIGIAAPTAQLHIDQANASGAAPVLTLDQGDVSEEMMEFLCTIGTGNAIEAIASKTLTTTHFIKVTIQGGLTRYIPVGTIA